ncbi:UNKNOWN [Stylonychia lemnae]|uniref:Uncharacterized protein n=1 Tax=Stylonychia lemnae TaxID=5949 RepID=A0A078A4S3_STYLE|nr:UNKNOWN [Stylonychia lemnae]|eukprot:CDW76555.1 UNKNOWN [Stylonychia lemnae]
MQRYYTKFKPQSSSSKISRKSQWRGQSYWPRKHINQSNRIKADINTGSQNRSQTCLYSKTMGSFRKNQKPTKESFIQTCLNNNTLNYMNKEMKQMGKQE